MEIPFPRFVGVPRIEKGRAYGQSVGRYSQKEGVDVVVSESLDNCREKVGDGARGHEAKEQNHLARVSGLIE